MADATTSSITIGADPERVMAVIADFAAYPEWADQVKTVEVVDEDAGPPGARPLRDRRRPDQGLLHAGLHVGARRPLGELDAGQGADPEGDGRGVRAGRDGRPDEVTYSLAVDLNIPMIGMLRRKAEKVIIDTALKGLKPRVEG